MHEDFIVKYRPGLFAEFWNRNGSVATALAYLRARRLPRSLILVGTYGTGKTSLARVIGRAASCHDTSSPEPCGECDGCRFPNTLLFGLCGSATLIRGNDFDREMLKETMRRWDPYPQYAGYGIHILIIDEAHRIPQRDQETLTDMIEDSAHTHFILCTTHEHDILDAVRARSRTLRMYPPTTEEALVGLTGVARNEQMEVPDDVLLRIISANGENPRRSLVDLQDLKTHGDLPYLHKEETADRATIF